MSGMLRGPVRRAAGLLALATGCPDAAAGASGVKPRPTTGGCGSSPRSPRSPPSWPRWPATGPIDGLVPEGTNTHTFEPPPSAAGVLSEADLVFVNGLQLEEPTEDLAEANHEGRRPRSSRSARRCCPKRDYIYDFSFPKEDGKPNPHLWTDPTYAIKYAGVIAGRAGEGRPRQRRATTTRTRRVRRSGRPRCRRAAHRPGDHPRRPARAADLPRRVRLLREDLRLDGHRRHPAVELRGPDPEGGRGAHRPGQGGEGAGDLRLGGLPLRGAAEIAERPARGTRTPCATTTCRVSPATPSTPGWA